MKVSANGLLTSSCGFEAGVELKPEAEVLEEGEEEELGSSISDSTGSG